MTLEEKDFLGIVGENDLSGLTEEIRDFVHQIRARKRIAVGRNARGRLVYRAMTATEALNWCITKVMNRHKSLDGHEKSIRCDKCAKKVGRCKCKIDARPGNHDRLTPDEIAERRVDAMRRSGQ